MHAFQISEVPAARRLLPHVTLASWLEARVSRPEAAKANNTAALVYCDGNPFVQAAHFAFSEHFPLELSPDDIWLCIAQGFSKYVNLNAEALRDKFVEHHGKATIRVRRDGFVTGSSANNWPGVIEEFCDQVEKRSRSKRLPIADFSTTGVVEKVASQIALLSTLQLYFDYRLWTLCGIPSITLRGTVEDWKSLRRCGEALAEFDLDHWARALIPVLDQFVAAADGRVDGEFWRSFYKTGEESGAPFVTGWINVLFPYITPVESLSNDPGLSDRARPNPFVEIWEYAGKDRKRMAPRHCDFLSGICRSPCIWEYFDQEISLDLLAGFVGVSQDPKTLAVRPVIGWAVCEAT